MGLYKSYRSDKAQLTDVDLYHALGKSHKIRNFYIYTKKLFTY